LQNNHVDTAHDEFVALKYHDELAEEFVQSAYSDSRVNLAQLAKFVCNINIFNTGYIGINALYKEMAKHNQLEEKQMILLYYRLKNLEMNEQFASILPELKEIESGSFYRSKEVIDVAKGISGGEQLFMYDLVRTYLSRTTLTKFTQLYNFAKSLPTNNSQCIAYAVIYQQLQVTGTGNTMEALAVWLLTYEIAKTDIYSHARCKEIASSTMPAYRDTLVSNYKNYVYKMDKTQK
jgi:hypothetical protein